MTDRDLSYLKVTSKLTIFKIQTDRCVPKRAYLTEVSQTFPPFSRRNLVSEPFPIDTPSRYNTVDRKSRHRRPVILFRAGTFLRYF